MRSSFFVPIAIGTFLFFVVQSVPQTSSSPTPPTDECNRVLSLNIVAIAGEREKADQCVTACKESLATTPPRGPSDPFWKMCALQKQRNSSRPTWATI